jgi:hypothetical protein
MHDRATHLDQRSRRAPSAVGRHGRPLVAATVLGVLGWVLALCGAAPAQAAAVNVVCFGTQNVALSPGMLLLTPRDVMFTVNDNYSPCVSASRPRVTSAQSHRSWLGKGVACMVAPRTASLSKELTWNNGQTSTFTFNQIATSVGGNSVITEFGSITAGMFAGATAVETVSGPANSLDCLSSRGLTNRFTTLQLVIRRSR